MIDPDWRQVTADLELTSDIDRESVGRYIHWAIPPLFRQAQTDQPEVIDWFAQPKGNLLLFGPIGVGKTHAVYGGLRRYLVARQLGLVPRGPEGIVFRGGPLAALVDSFRARDGDEAEIAEIEARRAEILFLDDLGATRLTDWGRERLFALIDHRYVNQKPTVACTNLLPTQLAGPLDARVVSRLDLNSTLVSMPGKDRRG